jgi:NTE family protein
LALPPQPEDRKRRRIVSNGDKTRSAAVRAPVELIDTGTRHEGLTPGLALCLSGGGYRAMLFHVGALWRLNEVGLLPKIERISSVSGGTITAGMLGLKWSRLDFNAPRSAQRFRAELVDPIRTLATKTIDATAIISGTLLPGSIGEKLSDVYRKHLFGNATL